MSRSLEGDLRQHIADILEAIARDGLHGPRDLDVALDAIGCAIYDAEDATASQSLPDGWVAVPKEADEKMMRAAVSAAAARLPDIEGNVGRVQIRAAWDAMLSAAPPLNTGGGE